MARQRNSGVWREVGALAARRHGVVSRRQLRELGIGEDAIDRAVASGHLYPLFHGVFGVGHSQVGRSGRLLAATLACGEGSVVSHGSAAALLGLWERPPSSIDVIAPVEAGRKIPGIRRRHPPPPLLGERIVHEGVPCTSPARTIVDIAGFVGPAKLRATIEQAAVNRMLDIAAIDAVLDGPRRRGSRHLLRVLERWRRYTPGMTIRSRFEAKLLPLLSEYGLPIPECNEKLRIGREEFEIDFLWRAQRLAVETDGGRFHDNPEALGRDSHRNRVLTKAGWRIWRLVWAELRDRPDATIADLARRIHTPLRSAVP